MPLSPAATALAMLPGEQHMLVTAELLSAHTQLLSGRSCLCNTGAAAAAGQPADKAEPRLTPLAMWPGTKLGFCCRRGAIG